jgi:hypothetical protein
LLIPYVYGFSAMRASPIREKVTLKPLADLSHALHVPGPPKHFTPKQLEVLREAVREIDKIEAARAEHDGRPWNQTLLGQIIGVGQQVAGRYLGASHHGMSYPTAMRVAGYFKFDKLDDFFEARLGNGADRKTQGMRDLAVSLAHKMGIDDAAIQAVLARYDSTEYDNRATKWWVGKFIEEDKDLVLPLVIEPQTSRVLEKQEQKPEPKKPRRKKVA